ncbi:MAG: hypothetical protein O7F76_05605, partial [Planctomycetota bacterium]|nr:hypothetical protein [Planctomycetota bacterium]
MTNPRDRRARAATGDPETRNDPAGTTPLVERLVLLVFLSLIPIRAVLSETHGFESPSLLRGLEDAPPTAGPATTLVIISTIAAGTLALACSRLWRGGPRYRRTGAELGALLLVAAAVFSTVRAGQRHLALIGVLDFLGMIALMFSLRQLLTRRRYIRLALCVILATG